MRTLAVVATLALAASTLSAQARPDFSGTWVLQLAQSDFGPIPAPTSRQDVIEHQEPALRIVRTQVTAGGEATATLSYAVDGKPHANRAGAADVVSVLAWEGAELVITSTISTPQGEATIVDRMALAANGTTLTQRRTISVQGQQIDQTMVLRKQ